MGAPSCGDKKLHTPGTGMEAHFQGPAKFPAFSLSHHETLTYSDLRGISSQEFDPVIR
jgi:hypothetical protein